MNNISLMGRLVADPETRTINNGVAVANMRIAVDKPQYGNNQQETDFIPIVAWRATAEFIVRNFQKGMQVYVTGRLQTHSWVTETGEKRFKFDVLASEVGFADTKKKNDSDVPAQKAAPQPPRRTTQNNIPSNFSPFSSNNNFSNLPDPFSDDPTAPDDNLPF